MMRVTTRLLVLLFLLATAGCSAGREIGDAANLANTTPAAQIYAAAISEIHAYARTSRLVYLISTTEDLVYADAPVAPAQAVPAELQAAITAELAEAQFELIWIETFDEAPVGPISPDTEAGWHVADGDGIVISVGNIHPQQDGSVLLSFFMTCADMCGVGKTFVVSQSGGRWQVTGSVGPEIAS